MDCCVPFSILDAPKRSEYSLSTIAKYQSGKYTCKGVRNVHPYSSEMSDAVPVIVWERPRAVLTLESDDSEIFTGETVTLRCDIHGGGVSQWNYEFHKNDALITRHYIQRSEYSLSTIAKYQSGKYTCKGVRNVHPYSSEMSDAVSVIVWESPKAVVILQPDKQTFRGETVTLRCQIQGERDTDWEYSWYKKSSSLSPVSKDQEYRISPVSGSHSGEYTCRGKHRRDSQNSEMSDAVTLTVSSGLSPPASLNISHNTTQHFTSDSLSLSCEVQSDSTGWTVRRYTDNGEVSDCSSDWGSVTGSTCSIRYLYLSNSGVYWCQSVSGGNSNPLNITVTDGDVILESPVHPVTEGDTLTLRCTYRHKPSHFRADFYKDGFVLQNQTTGEMTIPTVSKSDEGLYWCKHPVRGESPKSWITVRVSPESPVYTGEAVTLNCEIESGRGWTFKWYKGNAQIAVSWFEKITFAISTPEDEDQVWYVFYSTERPKPVVILQPDKQTFRGETVTLRCEIQGERDTDWEYNWFKKSSSLSPVSKDQEYRISPVNESHSGEYTCRGKRRRDSQNSEMSDAVTLIVSSTLSPPVSLIISPQRTQHFTSDSLSLSCEVQSNSTGWTVRRYTDNGEVSDCSSDWGSVTGSTCSISSLQSSDSGVYWCQSDSGWNSNPLNISVTNGDVILESPVHPVTEGDTLTLNCRYRNDSLGLRADFYKDGLVLQNQTTGEMTIPTVSKSDEGLYWCKYPERGESPKSWITVTVATDSNVSLSLPRLLCSLLVLSPYLLVTIVIGVKCW
ncbi:sialoadhesin-like, partial [Chanos chanos]|uniref:Sialoadhesin-like n=1 Tax=Chanos chanos TaxID=29144 RepID=A0A6J2VTG4_CHACN